MLQLSHCKVIIACHIAHDITRYVTQYLTHQHKLCITHHIPPCLTHCFTHDRSHDLAYCLTRCPTHKKTLLCQRLSIGCQWSWRRERLEKQVALKPAGAARGTTYCRCSPVSTESTTLHLTVKLNRRAYPACTHKAACFVFVCTRVFRVKSDPARSWNEANQKGNFPALPPIQCSTKFPPHACWVGRYAGPEFLPSHRRSFKRIPPRTCFWKRKCGT